MKNTTYSKPELAAGTTYCKRDRISGAIAEYRRRFDIDGRGEGAFRVSDLQTIRSISGGDMYTAVGSALEAGFMIGYRKGRRDAKA